MVPTDLTDSWTISRTVHIEKFTLDHIKNKTGHCPLLREKASPAGDCFHRRLTNKCPDKCKWRL